MEIKEALEIVKEYNMYQTEDGNIDLCSALDMALLALQKQLPKKPIEPQEDYGTFKCPNCGGLIYTTDEFETHKFCLMCGQDLDWRMKDGEE